jgi:hypothetical protein
MKVYGWPVVTKDGHYEYGERYWLYGGWKGQCYRYRQGPVPDVHKYSRYYNHRMWRSQSMAEKRQWYDYTNQMKENGFAIRMRRNAPELITTYDDWPINHYRGSWKQSTKKRRQWGGLVSLLYCG